MLDVNFNQEDPQIICHPQYEKLVPQILEGLKPYNLKHHFILFSSGTTGGVKGYAVSREALFANAKASNEHFQLTHNDIWALSLPIYHIGGLSVLARAHLLENQIIDARHWDPLPWAKKIEEATITTIVPTQLYDLVKLKLKAPRHLKYIIVGGDFLSASLKEEALKLGWPVIRTFGMSEVCSQLASAKKPENDAIEILPIHQVKIGNNQRLLVKSEALFTLQFILEKDKLIVTKARELCDEEGFYQSSDRAELSGNFLVHQGRLGDEFKVAGHLVNMNHLKDVLSAFLIKHHLFGKMEFTLEEDERKGKKLVLLTQADAQEKSQDIAPLIHPIKIDDIRTVHSFERTALGKLKKT